MTLSDLGYYKELGTYQKKHQLGSFEIGRVISEHKDRYIVSNGLQEFDAELIGNLRFTAQNRSDLPAVGDWVALSKYDHNKALIHALYPRKSILERKEAGSQGTSQIIAANIDYGLIIQSVNRDFSMNRLERYLTICNAAKIKPIIVLSKADLCEKQKLEEIVDKVKKRIKNVPIIPTSNQTQLGIIDLKSKLMKGFTYCLLGSSGVGKSTLINTLAGHKLMDTGAISESINRGKHVTSHRELVVLENGILIDNPGMREVGVTNMSKGLEITFDELATLALNCKFSDCNHQNVKGCAIMNALESKEIDEDAYTNFIKLEKERNHFESDALERKKKDKDFGKMIKHMKKQSKNKRF